MTADLFLNLCSYGSDILFYHGAFIFEDVGVTAFAGAVPVISAALAPVICWHVYPNIVEYFERFPFANIFAKICMHSEKL